MTVHAYCRSSQPPKAHRRDPDRAESSWLGCESQRQALLQQFPDATVWTDRAKSGRSARRPGLKAMLEAIEPGDIVAVVRLDRLARDSQLALALELQIEKTLGATLFSLAGEGTSLDGTRDPMQTFHRRIAAAVAELQAAQAGQATRAAFRVRKERGLTTNGRAVYGFTVADGGRIVPNHDEQEVIQFLHRTARGRLLQFTGQELADKLNRKGFTNRGGGPWTANAAKRLAQRLHRRQDEPVVCADG